MPDQEINQYASPIVAGGAFALIGGMVIALGKAKTPRQVAVTLMASTSLGGAAGGMMSANWGINIPSIAFICLFIGLAIIGILEGFQRLVDKAALNPGGWLEGMGFGKFVPKDLPPAPPADKGEGK